MSSSREAILATIRAGLEQNGAWLRAEATTAPHAPPPFVHPPAESLVQQFAEELGKLEGRVAVVADEEEALERIGAILEAKAADRVIAWDLDAVGLPGLPSLLAERGAEVLDRTVLGAPDRKERLQQLEPAQVCVSGVTAAIAESGSLLIVHGPGRGRLASLLAPFHVAVVRSGQIVPGLGAALARLRELHGADPFAATSNMTLITGPSRTADIEMTLTLGIHGPKEIHVVVIDEGRAP